MNSPSWLYEETLSEFAESEESAAASGSDSLDWLQGDPLDEALGIDSLNADADASASTLVQMRVPTPEDLAEQKPDAVEAPAPRRGLTSMLQETNFDWTNKQQDDTVSSDDEMDDWLNQFGPAEPRKAVNENSRLAD